MTRGMKFATTLIMLATVSACAARQTPPPATASDTEQTSLCLIDREIAVNVSPAIGIDDPGNQWDSEPTLEQVFEHNARLRAACGDAE